MNVVVLLGVAACGLLLIWGAQTLALLAVGDARPLAWPFRYQNESAIVRWSMKGAVQAAMLLLLVLPWFLGEDPLRYHAVRLVPARWLLLLETMGMTLLALSAVLLVNVCSGLVQFRRAYRWPTVCRKVLRACSTPLPLAFMEEAVFRGVVLEQLCRVLPSDPSGQGAAIGISALIFSAVHFLRPQKRVLLPALGLYGLGWTLGLAYLAGGHTYWLPVAVHAGGVLFIQVFRPFVEYRGPAWLIGYRSYPICGLNGLTAMALLTVWVVL